MIGVSVSYLSGRVSWRTLAGDGVRIAFVRATEGARFIDSLFYDNRDAAMDAGLLVVPYHVINIEPSTQQIINFRNVARFATMEAIMLQCDGGDVIAREMAEGLKQVVLRKPTLAHSRLIPKWAGNYPWYALGSKQPEGAWLFWGSPAVLFKGVFRRVEPVHFNGTAGELEVWFNQGVLPDLDREQVDAG